MATATVYVYNETTAVVSVSCTSQHMQTAPPSTFSVQPGKPYSCTVTAIDKTSSFTLTVDPAHVLNVTFDPTTKEYSITPTSFDDGTVGSLVAPISISNVNSDALNFLIGDGQPVTYLNGLLSALVPPAVTELNKDGPYNFKIKGIQMKLIHLGLDSSNLSCTYASRQGTGPASFNMQAILNATTMSAKVEVFGVHDITLKNLNVLITFVANADPNGLSLQVQSLQFSLPPAEVLPNFKGTFFAQQLNSDPTNADFIKAINEKLHGGFGGGLQTAAVAEAGGETTIQLRAEEAVTAAWAAPLATLLMQYAPASGVSV